MTEPTLESLRAQGEDCHDPVRFGYLQALARRLPAQPHAVQQVLALRLQQAITAYAASADQVSAGAVAPVRRAALAAPPSPLAQLNRELAARAQADEDRARIEGSASVAGLKSVRQFSEVWSRIAAQDQVLQALEQGPENAGPLNPHRLMLRSLSLMRSLSPDYLRRFLLQMDSLLWLEQAGSPQRAPLKRPRAGGGAPTPAPAAPGGSRSSRR